MITPLQFLRIGGNETGDRFALINRPDSWHPRATAIGNPHGRIDDNARPRQPRARRNLPAFGIVAEVTSQRLDEKLRSFSAEAASDEEPCCRCALGGDPGSGGSR